MFVELPCGFSSPKGFLHAIGGVACCALGARFCKRCGTASRSRLVQRFHKQIADTPHTWIEAGAGAFFQNKPLYLLMGPHTSVGELRSTLVEDNMYKRVLILGLVMIGLAAAPVRAQDAMAAAVTKARFTLTVNPAILTCLQQSTKNAPTATVTVVEGKLNDTLTIKLKHVKPGLAFDLFTVENSRFLSTGALDPAFVNFGLAWYQSDIEVGKSGSGSAKIQTILVNQIFGFDPEATLAPQQARKRTDFVWRREDSCQNCRIPLCSSLSSALRMEKPGLPRDLFRLLQIGC